MSIAFLVLGLGGFWGIISSLWGHRGLSGKASPRGLERRPLRWEGPHWSLFLASHSVGYSIRVWCHFSLEDLNGICQKELALKT